MALPQADIRLLEDGAITPVAYPDVEHVRITRAFLDDPASFLRRL
jgi:predicted ATPase